MKLKAYLLALMMLFSTMLFDCSVFAESIISDYSQSELSFINALGIGEGVDLSDPYRSLTRAEFAHLAVNMGNYAYSADLEGFSDVSADSDYAESIYAAKQLGLVSGTGPDSFSPKQKISYGAAVKIVTVILGYEQYALVNGGYPNGYFAAAEMSDILTGIYVNGSDTYLDVQTAVKLIYNALRADVFKAGAIVDNELSYTSRSGENLLTENFKLQYIKGIVQTAGVYSMVPGYKSSTALIDINGREFKTNIPNSEMYIGLKVSLWYDESEMEAVAIDIDSDNTKITIDSEDVAKFSNFTLETSTETSNKSYSFSKSYIFMKNGRHMSNTNDDFILSDGTLELIDNDGDNKFDIAHAREKDYFIISSIVNNSLTVYDKNLRDTNIVFDTTDDNYSILKVKDAKSGEFVDADFSYLTADMVLELYQSNDKSLVYAIAANETISGRIEEVSDDEIRISGTLYKKNTYFKANDKLTKPGLNAEFYLAPDGTLTFIKTLASSDTMYGFFLDYSGGTNGLLDSAKIKLLDTDGIIQHYILKDYITLDGVSKVKTNSQSFLDSFMYNGIPQYKPMRYSLDENGEIDMIDLAKDISGESDTEKRYDRVYGGDDSMRKHLDKKKTYYTGNMGAPYFFYTGTTTIFTIPSEMRDTTDTNVYLGDKIIKRYSDDMFSVKSVSSLVGGDSYVDAYDYNENFSPSVVVSYDNQGGTGSTSGIKIMRTSQNDPSYIVEQINAATDIEGVNTLRIYVLGMDGYKSYIISGQYYDALVKLNRIPKSGDIIRLSLTSQGEIGWISRDGIYDKASENKVTVQYDGTNANDMISDQIYKGVDNVFSYVTGRMQFKNSNTYGLIGSEVYIAATKYGEANELSMYRFGNADNIIVYNIDTNKARRGTRDDITDIGTAGVKASYICARVNYLTSTTIFVYETN